MGGLEQLVAPKRRSQAEGLQGDALLAWLAEDGGRLRRPIVDLGEAITVGYTADVQTRLRELLG